MGKTQKDLEIAEKKVGMVSLGCPKALVDSERILTRLKAEGYIISPSYEDADAVIVNTCGFLDSAREESLNSIQEAITKNGKVIVTGCLGKEKELISKTNPQVLAITGPQQYEQVIQEVHKILPPINEPFLNLVPNASVKLTPRHYSYLKISEGCNHKCKFCIIPDLRGPLVSRKKSHIIAEAIKLAESGVKELLIISQDTSAYGFDKLQLPDEKDQFGDIFELAKELGKLDMWIRLHYVYPYPSVEKLIPLMTEGKILPYLDIPFQHSHPDILKKMARPANHRNISEKITLWRKMCPDLTIRSSFIVGFPGETEEHFQSLLNWIEEMQIDRIGCFKYENVKGSKSYDMVAQVPEPIKNQRYDQFMKKAQDISTKNLEKKLGSVQEVIVDKVGNDGAICRTKADAPEIDGNLFVETNFNNLKPGDFCKVLVEDYSEYDLWGKII